MRRAMPYALGLIFAVVPLFPSFIALAPVQFPGFSLVPRGATLAVLGLCVLLAIYATVTLLRYPRAGSQPLLVPLASVFGAGVLAGAAGFNPVAGMVFTGIGGLSIIWHCSVMRFYSDRNAAHAIYLAILISGAIASLAAVIMVAAKFPAAQYAVQHGRATGAFILPGELAGFLIVLIPIAYACTRVTRHAALRLAAWFALGVGALALALTYSRAGWMGFAAAVAFLIAIRTRRAGAAALIVVAGVLAVLLLFNAHHDPSEDYTRLSIWRTAIQIVDRFTLTGVGPFNFVRLYATLRAPDGDPTAFHAHDLYLTFFAEFGILGLLTVAWTTWRFGAELRRRLQASRPSDAFLSLSVTAGLFGVAVQGLIDTVSLVIFGLWMPIMALALASAQGSDPELA
jgi:hypothetical protein